MLLWGLTVSVDYTDYLAKSLVSWRNGLDRLVVVTTPADRATQALCQKHSVETHVTDIFYANGAHFNKGAALAEAVASKKFRQPADEWLLSFDSDIVPPPDWRRILDCSNLQPGVLYGALRYQVAADGKKIATLLPIRSPVGYFFLFHALDPSLPAFTEPLFELCWMHAGRYDTVFCWRWPQTRCAILSTLKLLHLGPPTRDWAGRYHPDRLAAIFRRRNPREARFTHERLDNPPVLLQNR